MASWHTFIILVLTVISLSETRKPRGRPPQEGLTLDFLYGRLRSVERKLAKTQQEISSTQGLLKNLESKLSSQVNVQGSAPSAVIGTKFSDLHPCPIRGERFYYAPQFRSCYRLEARDQLENHTEALRHCRRLATKSDLVSIETQAEQEFLEQRWQSELGIGSLVRFWTSARRNGGKWAWEAVNKPLTYNKWIPTTEHNDDRFSCMSVFSNEAYNWGDVACWAPNLITCEINL